jgi:tetratricopeptide (TPR) repeat protein
VIVRDAQGAESLIDVEVRPGETRQVDATVRSADGAPTPGARPERKSAGGLLDEARGALKQGDSRAALGAYRRLMSFYPNSPEASTVLVTVGKLELKQNSPARALNAFDVYLRRGGPLQPEALAGKIRALRALGRAAGERAAIESYLKHYPTGFEAVALKKRLEVLSGR